MQITTIRSSTSGTQTETRTLGELLSGSSSGAAPVSTYGAPMVAVEGGLPTPAYYTHGYEFLREYLSRTGAAFPSLDHVSENIGRGETPMHNWSYRYYREPDAFKRKDASGPFAEEVLFFLNLFLTPGSHIRGNAAVDRIEHGDPFPFLTLCRMDGGQDQVILVQQRHAGLVAGGIWRIKRQSRRKTFATRIGRGDLLQLA